MPVSKIRALTPMSEKSTTPFAGIVRSILWKVPVGPEYLAKVPTQSLLRSVARSGLQIKHFPLPLRIQRKRLRKVVRLQDDDETSLRLVVGLINCRDEQHRHCGALARTPEVGGREAQHLTRAARKGRTRPATWHRVDQLMRGWNE